MLKMKNRIKVSRKFYGAEVDHDSLTLATPPLTAMDGAENDLPTQPAA